MKAVLLFVFVAGLSLAWIDGPVGPKDLHPDDYVARILEELGDTPASHHPDTTLEGVSVEFGRQLVTRGSLEGGAGLVSRNFVCTACHNIERDEPALSFVDPQARLDYAAKKGLPYLPGSMLYGAVDRVDFYNGDYEKKYGDLVRPARNNLREAIQLCAVECSQGRRLQPVELESVLAYLWTIGLRIDDLGLSESQLQQVESALNGNGDKPAAIALLKSHYSQGAPATFIAPPNPRSDGSPVPAKDAANGRKIYELSCLHCHENQHYAFFRLDESRFTYQFLDKHIPRYTRYSIYQVIRWGTSPMPGKRTYMPNYTQEKLSDQMVEDLRAYIELRARGEELPE